VTPKGGGGKQPQWQKAQWLQGVTGHVALKVQGVTGPALLKRYPVALSLQGGIGGVFRCINTGYTSL
jgi:hypothetical protein